LENKTNFTCGEREAAKRFFSFGDVEHNPVRVDLGNVSIDTGAVLFFIFNYLNNAEYGDHKLDYDDLGNAPDAK
jgi:hypothetical protein